MLSQQETTVTSKNQQTLDDLVADNCRKLFSHYNLEIRAGKPDAALPTEPFLLCGVIGFSSKFVRGALVLATTREPLELTNPTQAPSYRDWICELSNQLLGRVKNQMLRRGVEIYPATPVALRGDHLSPVLQKRLVAELFTAERGVVGVWMDCEFEEGFELPDSDTCDVEPVPEGELLLF